jgi:hypothetical protein
MVEMAAPCTWLGILDWKKGEAMVGSLALMPFCTDGCRENKEKE